MLPAPPQRIVFYPTIVWRITLLLATLCARRPAYPALRRWLMRIKRMHRITFLVSMVWQAQPGIRCCALCVLNTHNVLQTA